MQFAGQRTDADLKPIGEPYNILIKLTDDVLPDPGACLVTGITPQKTLAEGITEAEFIKIFDKEIKVPGTIFIGFNSIRFDDEFMRFLFYRNYYDPYEWQWKDGCGRWDLLDVSRMTRALRPEGIKWPRDSAGKPTNRLELLSAANGLDHSDAHDALSDVKATIALAELIKNKTPKIFDYLLSVRDKKSVQRLCSSRQPFIYTSGKYPGEFEKTTVVLPLGPHPDRNGVLVYDLRHDPKEFIDLKPEELAKLWRYDKEAKKVHLPVKSLQFNRCPAIAPLGVLDKASQKRLAIDLKQIDKNRKILADSDKFYANLTKAAEILNSHRKEQPKMIEDETSVDAKLYEGFIPDSDKKLSEEIRKFGTDELMSYEDKLADERLKKMLLLYKGRNHKKALSPDEYERWENYRKNKLLSGGEKSQFACFGKKLEEYAANPKLSEEDKYLIEELKLYGLGIRPED